MTTPKRIELPTGLPVGGVNVYLFTKPEPVLVDCGIKSDESLTVLRASLAEESLTLADLSQVIISHPHTDHYGLAGIILGESRANIHILSASIPWLVDYRAMWAQRNRYYQDDLFVRWSLPADIAGPILNYYRTIENSVDSVPLERIKPFAAGDRLLVGGVPWQVLHTPGHAATLTCFYQPDTRQFLSTDMLLPITPTPIPEPPAEGQTDRAPSLPQYIESLKVVEALECDIVYPGHGEPFTDHRALIQRQRDRIWTRKEECLAFIKGGLRNLGDLVLALYPHYPPAYRFAGLWMALGYLDLLAAAGEITLVEQPGDEPKRLEIRLNK
jgi:glyoxylase-like metal-dependent hydrolase (beta-lactamase superfamily II)